MNARNYIDEIKSTIGARTDEQLASILGTSKSAIDKWVQRNKIPEKWLLKIGQIGQKAQIGSNDLYSIPIVSISASAGSAGNRLDAIDTISRDRHIRLDKAFFRTPPQGTIKALQIEGDSMEPKLRDGDWVLFDEIRNYNGDGLYVIDLDCILMVKQLQLNPITSNMHVKSLNPAYESYTIDEDNQLPFRIIGRVLRTII